MVGVRSSKLTLCLSIGVFETLNFAIIKTHDARKKHTLVIIIVTLKIANIAYSGEQTLLSPPRNHTR